MLKLSGGNFMPLLQSFSQAAGTWNKRSVLKYLLEKENLSCKTMGDSTCFLEGPIIFFLPNLRVIFLLIWENSSARRTILASEI